MNSPGLGWLFPLYPWVFGAAVGAAAPWWSVAGLRQFLDAPRATPVAHWAGPDAAAPDAAFLALHIPQTGVRSIVALKEGIRVGFDGKVRVEGKQEPHPITSLDLAGVRVGSWAILFHTESGLLRSAFSFDTGPVPTRTMRYVIGGVYPGTWEIWRDGWVVDIGVVVNPREGVLYFEGRPGSYFVRKLN